MKKLSFLLALSLIAGCSTAQRQTVSARIAGQPITAPAEGVAADAPRMIAELRAHKVAGRFTRVAERQGVTRWKALEDGVEIYTSGPIVIGTRGMGYDLMSLDDGGAAKLIAARSSGQVNRIYRSFNGENQLEIHAYVCDIARPQARSLRKGDATIEAQYIDENCQGPRGSFSNGYWFHGGALIRSDQMITPQAGMMLLKF